MTPSGGRSGANQHGTRARSGPEGARRWRPPTANDTKQPADVLACSGSAATWKVMTSAAYRRAPRVCHCPIVASRSTMDHHDLRRKTAVRSRPPGAVDEPVFDRLARRLPISTRFGDPAPVQRAGRTSAAPNPPSRHGDPHFLSGRDQGVADPDSPKARVVVEEASGHARPRPRPNEQIHAHLASRSGSGSPLLGKMGLDEIRTAFRTAM